MRWRIAYGVLVALTIVTYSMPWAKVGGEVYTGWSSLVPFSLTYFIGILLGMVVLFAQYKPIAFTVTAGISMLLGVIGGMIGNSIAGGLAHATGSTPTSVEAGVGLSFLMSMVFLVGGSVVARRLKKIDVVVETT